MTITITKAQLKAMRPCDEPSRLALFGDRTSMDASQAFAAGATVRDLLWVAGQLGKRELIVQFALACAQRVEHLDKTGLAKACNVAVARYIADPSVTNRNAMFKARSAAYAAYATAAINAAAYATAAANATAATNATTATAAYANAAANATTAYATTAYAAAATNAADNEVAAQQAIFIRIFV